MNPDFWLGFLFGMYAALLAMNIAKEWLIGRVGGDLRKSKNESFREGTGIRI